ncbi:AraC family transcriptional regulator [Ulvibacter sp. MAR_2010_11]|uniref:AraC family transcriptional regulator n=1 Tax=Ulvibacter sp. MAR_2010_11 TaxID=1250229 RepID=UPI000C2BAEAB|nr:AraC family transcriptional regulator [Ulvibacter sp. MAR_2010_11]PKA82581.1 AraC family transcriptional regulator [Ulvibacter sp. MAR_2010_11]
MKILPFTIPKPKRDTLLLQEDKGPVFYSHLHQHEEIQISVILSGVGTLLVGDTVTSYSEGDVLIFGSNLPHVFRSDTSKNRESHMLSIFFTEASFGDNFFLIEELKSLQPFFKKAENGCKLTSKKQQIAGYFAQLFKASKFDRFLLFLQLLKILSTAQQERLSSFVSEKKYKDTEGKRMSAIFEYTMTHFRNPVSLKDIAEQAAMTENAFCRYFKKRTRKTFVTFLNELRIEEACKLIHTEKELSIAEISERAGFQNVSNFNRKFLELKRQTPREYLKHLVQ